MLRHEEARNVLIIELQVAQKQLIDSMESGDRKYYVQRTLLYKYQALQVSADYLLESVAKDV